MDTPDRGFAGFSAVAVRRPRQSMSTLAALECVLEMPTRPLHEHDASDGNRVLAEMLKNGFSDLTVNLANQFDRKSDELTHRIAQTLQSTIHRFERDLESLKTDVEQVSEKNQEINMKVSAVDSKVQHLEDHIKHPTFGYPATQFTKVNEQMLAMSQKISDQDKAIQEFKDEKSKLVIVALTSLGGFLVFLIEQIYVHVFSQPK